MKKMHFFWSALFIFLFAGPSLMGQPGKFGTGPDSTECRQKLSFYREYVRSGDIMSAVPSWRIAIKLCPNGVNQNLYADGQVIIKKLMQQPGVTPEHREGLIDSLMLMYDIRIQNYPQNALGALVNKIVDLGNFRPDAKEKQIAELERLINMAGTATPTNMLAIYMGAIRNAYMEDKRTAEDMMDTYSRLITILETQEKNQPDNEDIKANKQVIEMTEAIKEKEVSNETK